MNRFETSFSAGREARLRYMDADFQTLSYYNEKMYEENWLIKHMEAGFLTDHNSYHSDSIVHHSQLVLHRRLTVAEIMFRREEFFEKQEKAKRKALKKEEDFEEKSRDGSEIPLLGPGVLLKEDPLRLLGYNGIRTFHLWISW